MAEILSCREMRQRFRARVLMQSAERAKRRAESARKALGKSPEIDTAADYIEHYNRYGWRHFTRDHCPTSLFPEVAAARAQAIRGAQ